MGNAEVYSPQLLDTIPLDVGEVVLDISCGQDHTLAVTSNGKVFGWGSPKYGKLGQLDQKSDILLPRQIGGVLSDVKVVSVCCGESHSCAIDSEGKLYTWGFGGSGFSGGGMLGHGSNTQEDQPRLVESLVEEGVVITKATAGELHTAVLTSEGEVMSCGAGEYGRLGHGGSSDVKIFFPVEDLEEDVIVELVGGHAFTMALSDEGKLYVWGRNDQGQLGLGGTLSLDVYSMETYPVTIDEFSRPGAPEIATIAAGHSHAALVTKDGVLWMWGNKNYLTPKQFEVLDENGNPEVIKKVACGHGFTAAITEHGKVYTFGDGSSRCLGHGDKKRQPQPTLVEAFAEESIDFIRAGHRHVVAFTK
jgi:E3 ubiquitin-protein ligase HERC2